MDLQDQLTSQVGATKNKVVAPANVQKFDRDAFHRWYNFVLGFSDQLVAEMLTEFAVGEDEIVLDPFCGTGTTVIECAKRGIKAIGLDANPFAVFAANTKSKVWVDPSRVLSASRRVEQRYRKYISSNRRFKNGKVFDYLFSSGMIARGWISPKPLRKALALREAILRCRDSEICDVLLLALLADLSNNIGNMRFGPQIHIGAIKTDVDPLPNFRQRVAAICEDLGNKSVTKVFKRPSTMVGDARSLRPSLKQEFGDDIPLIDFVICSPPYPTEHDYTRHTRLELIFTDLIESRACLRTIKRTMVRSHTKGIYRDDDDLNRAKTLKSVEAIALVVEDAIRGKSSGFEKLYPTVVRAYFGGMKRHFSSLFKLMKPGGRAAYVVGDQAAYLRVPIRTAVLLGETAETVGFKVETIRLWRKRWSTGISDYLEENILILRKPLAAA
jgi:SAM-dependent methyltransferase